MEFKLPPLDVPRDNPFKFDALSRKQSIEALSNLIAAVTGPFTLAIDSPWGTGKSTFVRMWKAHLESQGYLCLYFDAWSTDFASDPLVAFLGELEALSRTILPSTTAHLQRAKKIATMLARRALPAAGKIATAGLLDIDELSRKTLSEAASDTIKDLVDVYTAEKDLIQRFRESLSKTISEVQAKGKRPQLIVFVDEVDRCKPSFAVALLERIKHLFDVPNAIFVLAIDKSQLAVSLTAVYGAGLNAEEYLRRFLDLEYLLPKANAESFFSSLYERFGLDAFFKERTHSDLQYESKNLAEAFNVLSNLYDLSLRAREQCLTRIRVAMMTTPSNHYFYPFLLTTLVVMRAGAPLVYRRYAMEEGKTKDVLEHIRSLLGGEKMLSEHVGTVIEAHLIAAKSGGWNQEQAPEYQQYNLRTSDQTISTKERERAGKMVTILNDLSHMDRRPSLPYVVNKIELATQFKQ